MNRRRFIHASSGLAAGMGLLPLSCQPSQTSNDEAGAGTADLFTISLAQWSLHRSFFSVNPRELGWDEFGRVLASDNYRSLLGGALDPMYFARTARQDFGIEAVEYVNTFYFDRAEDQEYLRTLKSVADDEGVRSVLMMCDAEGAIGDPDEAKRIETVENHHKWVRMASFMGCHSIRVNAQSDPSLSPEEQKKLAADGLRRLCEFADPYEINVLVENHGGISSNGVWLAGVMELTDHPRVGTLPDFGNFYMGTDPYDDGNIPELWYDRYKGVEELMPYAKSVSAKSIDFDESGNVAETDFHAVMKTVLDAGFRGFVGIEYDGTGLSEPAGVRATKALLERVREQFAGDYP